MLEGEVFKTVAAVVWEGVLLKDLVGVFLGFQGYFFELGVDFVFVFVGVPLGDETDKTINCRLAYHFIQSTF